jgi:hypothetical protein
MQYLFHSLSLGFPAPFCRLQGGIALAVMPQVIREVWNIVGWNSFDLKRYTFILNKGKKVIFQMMQRANIIITKLTQD